MEERAVLIKLEVQPSEKGYCLESTLRLPRPLSEVFPFFADATNLEAITPPSLGFSILTPLPIEMHAGQILDYKLRIHGIPVRWRSEISEWDPPFSFVDEQVNGPYRWWKHRHRFEAHGSDTFVHDSVEYGVPGGGMTNRLFVKAELLKIFTYRAEALMRTFPGAQHASG